MEMADLYNDSLEKDIDLDQFANRKLPFPENLQVGVWGLIFIVGNVAIVVIPFFARGIFRHRAMAAQFSLLVGRCAPLWIFSVPTMFLVLSILGDENATSLANKALPSRSSSPRAGRRPA
jgi:hypothetical protein